MPLQVTIILPDEIFISSTLCYVRIRSSVVTFFEYFEAFDVMRLSWLKALILFSNFLVEILCLHC